MHYTNGVIETIPLGVNIDSINFDHILDLDCNFLATLFYQREPCPFEAIL